MSRKIPQCVVNTQELLNELERDHELEVLREYLTRFNLFPRTRDPLTAPIRSEELKELIKYWKLHRQRGFWRNHPQKEDLVRTLHKHIETKILPNETRLKKPEELQQQQQLNLTQQQQQHLNPRPPNIKPKTIESGKNYKTLRAYQGDLFGQRGNYEEGIIYLSRLGRRDKQLNEPSQKSTSLEENKSNDMNKEEDDEDEEDDKIAEGDGEGSNSWKGHGERQMKRKCAANLYQISLEEGNEEALCIDNSIPAVVRLSMCNDIETKRFASATLANLAYNPNVCVRMVEEGVLAAFSELSKSQNEEIRSNTALAICRISCDRQGQQRLLHEGGVSSMLTMLNAIEYETREACIKALINVSSLSQSSVGEGVIHAILTIINAQRDKIETLKNCAIMIRNLSIISGSRVKAVEDGILNAIIELMKTSNEEIHLILSQAFYNFSGILSNHALMVERNVLGCFQVLFHSSNKEIQRLCTLIVSNLSFTTSARLHLIEGNLLSSLISLSTTISSSSSKEEDDCQESISLCLSNLTCRKESQLILANDGVIEAFLNFLNKGNTTSTKQFAVLGLCNLMFHPQIRLQVIQCNLVPLLEKFALSEDEKLQEICALAFYNLSCDIELQKLISEMSTLETIFNLFKINMLKSFNQCQSYCIGILYNLSFGEYCKIPNLTKTIIQLLVQLYKINTQKELLPAQCSTILCNLSFSFQCRKTIREDIDGIQLISKFILMNTMEVLYNCASTLCNIATEISDSRLSESSDSSLTDSSGSSQADSRQTCSSESRQTCSSESRQTGSSESRQTGSSESKQTDSRKTDSISNTSQTTSTIISMLLTLSNIPYPQGILFCAIAFSKLASNLETRKLVALQEQVPPILTMMMRSGLEDIQNNAAIALCNLACEKTNSSSKNIKQKSIWKEGTIPDFIVNSLLRVNSNATKEICACALYNLLAHDEYRLMHLKEGVFYALIKLGRLESLKIRSLCALSLYNLSCDTTLSQNLIEMNVVQIVTNLCESEYLTLEMRRQLADSLINICSSEENERILLETGIIGAVTLLANEKDELTLKSCAALLHHLSYNEKGCELMAVPSVLTVLKNMILCEQMETQLYGTNILCNMSQKTALHPYLVSCNVVKVILEVLQNPNIQDVVIQSTIKVLGNITSQPIYITLALEEELLISTFVHVLTNNFNIEDVAPILVYVLARMSQEEQLIQLLLDHNIIQGILVALNKCTYKSLIHGDCITCLCHMSCSPLANSVMMEYGILSTLAALLIQEKEIQLSQIMKHQCSVILRNLSICCENFVLSKDFVLLLIALSSNHDAETCFDCAIALYNTLTKKGTKGLIEETGAIAALIHLAQSGHQIVCEVCSVALAQIDAEVGHGKRSIEEGLVKTLVSMLDMEQVTLTKVEKDAKEMSKTFAVVDVAWVYRRADNLEKKDKTIIESTAQWVVKTIEVKDDQFKIQAPKDYMQPLQSISAESTAVLKDTIQGSFELLHGTKKKVVLRKKGGHSDSSLVKNLTPVTTNETNSIGSSLVKISEDEAIRAASPTVKPHAAPHSRVILDKNASRLRSISGGSRSNINQTKSNTGRRTTFRKSSHDVVQLPALQ